MTLLKFEEILRRFGPVVDQWPADLIEPALDLLQASTAAQDMFSRASIATPCALQAGSPAGFGDETNFTSSKSVH
jgi:hypothetical protein